MKLHVINNIRTPFRQDNYLLLYQRYWPLKMLHVSIPKGHHQARISKRRAAKYPELPSVSCNFTCCNYYFWGTAVAQWLRCGATNRKFVGSIPAGVNAIFHWHKILPIALWSCGRLSRLRNEYQEHFLGVKAAGAQGWPYYHPVPLSWNLRTLTSGTLWATPGL